MGIWPGQGGVWVKYSGTGAWERLSSTADWIACGKMRGTGGATSGMELPAPIGGYVVDTGRFFNYEDLSGEGPGGWNFVYQEEANLIPHEQGRLRIMRVSGPGESGFKYIEQKNLIPIEAMSKERDRKKK